METRTKAEQEKRLIDEAWCPWENEGLMILYGAVSKEPTPCLNCGETVKWCRCMRNKCVECGRSVGNVTFTVCDCCWDRHFYREEEWADG